MSDQQAQELTPAMLDAAIKSLQEYRARAEVAGWPGGALIIESFPAAVADAVNAALAVQVERPDEPDGLYRVGVEGGGTFLYDAIDAGRLMIAMAEQGDKRPVTVSPARLPESPDEGRTGLFRVKATYGRPGGLGDNETSGSFAVALATMRIEAESGAQQIVFIAARPVSSEESP